MPMNDEDMLSAVTAGVESLNAAPAPVDEDSVEDSDTSAVEEAATVENSDIPAEGDVEAKAEGEVLDADGKIVAKEAKLDKDGKPIVEKPVAEKAPVVKDPINDPIPALMKKDTRERIQTLVSTVKAVSGERDQAVSERDELVSHILETKSTPEQYGEALSVLKMLNSGVPAQVEKAIGFLQQIVSVNARAIGKPVAGVDMLEGYDDLKQEVADGAISQQRAEEVAASRERAKHQTATEQHRQQTEQHQAATTAATNEGKRQLNELGARLSSTDRQFEAKHAIIVGALRDAIAVAHPSRWASMYENAYNRLKLPSTPPPPVPSGRAATPIHQPLRAKTPAGGQQKTPGSLLEAISMGVDSAAR